MQQLLLSIACHLLIEHLHKEPQPDEARQNERDSLRRSGSLSFCREQDRSSVEHFLSAWFCRPGLVSLGSTKFLLQ